MKWLRVTLSVVLISLSTLAFSQSGGQKSGGQKSFDQLKTLAGSWEGSFQGKPTHITIRVTSRGHAILHEIRMAGIPDDPITMVYLDGDQLLLTHYCDAGNRPRMQGKLSPDGKTVDFTLLDVANYKTTQGGHMQHGTFNLVDANHHSEDWTFLFEGKPPMRVHFDLTRAK